MGSRAFYATVLVASLTAACLVTAQSKLTGDSVTMDGESNTVVLSKPVALDSAGFEVVAERAWQPVTDSEEASVISFNGNVEIRTGDGHSLRTSAATYYPQLSTVTAAAFSVQNLPARTGQKAALGDSSTTTSGPGSTTYTCQSGIIYRN